LLQLDIAVHGVSVHSGLAHLGRNAVEGAARLVSAVLALKEQVLERRSGVETHPDTGLLLMEPRLNVNLIEGGLARNIVPDLCRCSIDRRLLPEESAEAAREELLATLRSVPGVEWEVVREFVIPPVPCCDDPAAGVMAGIIRDVTGTTGLYGAMMSGELPGAACGPWGGQSFGVGLIRPDSHIHGVDEHVCVADMDRLTEVLARFLSGDRKEAA
jgi:succinyl-diaminopimelate desuccinylase